MMVYFDKIRGTVLGEVYFRVSKHLSIPMSDVIRNKFNPDMRMLISFYYREIRLELKQKEELDEKTKNKGKVK